MGAIVDEFFAVSTIPAALPADEDYDAIYATVIETVRGRWFLEEFAKRNRNAETGAILSAIERIEAVIRGDRTQQAHQSFRLELLEMAKAITDVRAEVPAVGSPQPAPPPGPRSDIFAAAERLRDLIWTQRDRGLDASTCDQIDAIADSILGTAALRDSSDERAGRLGEVLGRLERRINAMLESCANGAITVQDRELAPPTPVATTPSDEITSAPSAMEPSAAQGDGRVSPERTEATPTTEAALTVQIPADVTACNSRIAPAVTIDAVASSAGDAVHSTAATPSHQGEMLSAVRETAFPRDPNLAAPQVALTSEPDPSAPPADAVEPEPADFLLEPLSMPLRISRAQPPETPAPPSAPPAASPDPHDEAPVPAVPLAELDDELFVEPPAMRVAPGQVAAAPAPSIIEQPSAAVIAAPSPSLAPAAPTEAVPAHVYVKPMPRPAPNDPLAALNAMSDEERIAIFT